MNDRVWPSRYVAVPGAAVGAPMAAQTAPTHGHTFQTSLHNAGKNISAIGCSGGCNEQAAENGSYGVPSSQPGHTNGDQPESANLPFIQLVVCRKD